MYLTQGLHRAVQQFPNRIAVRYAGRQHTYREFAERVARFAGALQGLGVKPGEPVAILSLNSACYLEYYLAVPWAGAAVNPCNTRWSAAEIAYSLDDSKTRVLIVDASFAPMVDALKQKCSSIREVIYAGDNPAPAGMHDYEKLVADAKPIPDAWRHGNDLAGIFYTGGTTGFPKGVMLSHLNLWSSGIQFLAEGLVPPGSVYLHAAPMFHMADGAMMIAQVLRGGTHAIIPAFKPSAVFEAVEQDRVTDTILVPTMVQMVVDDPDLKNHDMSSIKRILYGASPIAEAVLDRAMRALPGVEFIQAYGMTELSPIATVNPAYYHTPEGRKLGKIRSAGRASYGVEVRIIDPDDQEVPRGTVGEIAVRGPNVMVGYLGKDEQTAAALRGGWMHTGDGAYMDDDGFIFIVDRIKDMIVTGGENVYSTEVENAVAQHPAVASSAVIGIPSAEWGEAVHAVVILKPGAKVTAEELKTHCKQLIAGYKCPRSVEFRDALPLSGAGKVLKTELRKPFWKDQVRQVN